jgi:hypothetical protein
MFKSGNSFNDFGFFHFITVYIFDPRSAIPLAVQTNVLQNSSFLAASFQPNMKGLTVQNKKSNVTMAGLFYMNNKQVRTWAWFVYIFSIKCSCIYNKVKYGSHYRAVQYSTVQYSTVQYSTVQSQTH